MNTEVATPQLPAPIQGRFNIALTNSKFQQLADEAGTLIYNEDNLQKIKDYLDKTRKVEKAIEDTHKDGKAEALNIGRQWDAGKNSFLAMVANIKSFPQQEYTRICNEVLQRQRDQEAERFRISNIKQGIESNAILFAKQIAECETTPQLTALESRINLEKTRKEKYQEFLPDAIARFSELNAILANQKKIVKGLEENARLQLEAKQKQDDEALLKLQQQQEQQQAQMEENKVVVQETAIAQSVNAVEYAQEVITAAPKARRTTWSYEVINEKEVMKKSPELVIFTLDTEKVKSVLKTLKDTEQLEGKTEMIVNGIRFFEQKTF
jgi:hypothetical protein